MADVPPSVHMTVQPDPRFVPGLGEAVAIYAQLCGLATAACADMRAATEDVVRDTFDLAGNADHPVEIRLLAFADRMEVALAHHGEPLPTAGLDTFLTAGAQGASGGYTTGISLITRVDRVLYNTENGVSRTTLVKYRK